MLLATLLLVFIGIVMVFSSSWPEGIKKNIIMVIIFFKKKQLIAAGVGTVALLFFL